MNKDMEQTNQNQNPQAQQQSQQPTGFKCPKDCRKCLQSQRIYCASQHALSNMYVLDKVMEGLLSMKEQIEVMRGEVKELAAKIEAIQNSEAAVFDPDGATEGDLFPRVYGEAEESAE